MAETVLSVENLRCGYGDTEIIHGISFDVSVNERLCILGPNGCGKTTLLRAINRIIPYQGKVCAAGMDLSRAKRRDIARAMAAMSQINSIYFPYKVYETVLMGRYSYQEGILSRTGSSDREIAEESLRQTGTWELRDRPLTELSGGQLQRVMLARVFAQTPDIILLDEPLNHLDLKYQLELMEYLDSWVKEPGHCVVSVLHDVNMALSYADSVLLMSDGRIAARGAASDFPLELIDGIYGMDVCGYMRKSLARWEVH